ncbi:MAG TPA: thiamine pyrophosphate-binding protein [Geminicoccus sp.]|uniref:thiamine pyrophosphate-binding protein n=1 Tax=Geminicoccus sp. TaxID=2024832 RepID=UPI002E374A4B|nr:thiamine pyrophosphate-binding protein [Geminicoccus sp.]HEX2526858.1 thiamine pyrophosphate-binding protein [Geminicoccus sp.]
MIDDRPWRVADQIARTLHAHGIRHAFGMPGGEVVTLIDGLGRSGIAFVLARHETPAAIMAAGTYWATGAPGLLVTTLGPGLANAVNGIADAWQERVPLIVLSGVVERTIRGRYTHQIVDHAALLRPLVKASFEVEPEGAADVVARAIRLATTRPYGPVHLDLSPASAAQPSPSEALIRPAEGARPQVDPSDPILAMVCRKLSAASRPVVVAGLDAARPAASEPLRLLLERLGAPLITTYRAKGVVDERHPLVLGGAGLSPLADRHLLPALQAADLVLLAGYDPIEMRPGWMDPFPSSALVIELAAVPVDHGMHRVDIRLQGEPADLLHALVQGLDPEPHGRPSGPERIRAPLEEAFAAPHDRFGPHAVAAALQDMLTPDTTLTVDSGAHRILLSQKLQLRHPLQLLQSSGWCTMGAALPLAIGVKRARPDRQVVAVMGDGGLEMVAGELATLRDLGLPVTLVVLQDQSLALIALKQAQARLPPAGVALPASDLVGLAAAFGGHGVRAGTRDALARALGEAAARDVFTLIVCPIDAEDYVGRI